MPKIELAVLKDETRKTAGKVEKGAIKKDDDSKEYLADLLGIGVGELSLISSDMAEGDIYEVSSGKRYVVKRDYLRQRFKAYDMNKSQVNKMKADKPIEKTTAKAEVKGKENVKKAKIPQSVIEDTIQWVLSQNTSVDEARYRESASDFMASVENGEINTSMLKENGRWQLDLIDAEISSYYDDMPKSKKSVVARADGDITAKVSDIIKLNKSRVPIVFYADSKGVIKKDAKQLSPDNPKVGELKVGSVRHSIVKGMPAVIIGAIQPRGRPIHSDGRGNPLPTKKFSQDEVLKKWKEYVVRKGTNEALEELSQSLGKSIVSDHVEHILRKNGYLTNGVEEKKTAVAKPVEKSYVDKQLEELAKTVLPIEKEETVRVVNVADNSRGWDVKMGEGKINMFAKEHMRREESTGGTTMIRDVNLKETNVRLKKALEITKGEPGLFLEAMKDGKWVRVSGSEDGSIWETLINTFNAMGVKTRIADPDNLLADVEKMAFVPSNQLREAVALVRNRGGSTGYGRGWSLGKDGKDWKLYHYGTLILTIDEEAGTYTTGGGYSASDRDAMNGLVELVLGTVGPFGIRDGDLIEL